MTEANEQEIDEQEIGTMNLAETIDFYNTQILFRETFGRVQRSFTLGKRFDTAWRDFIETYSGTKIRPGNGISSVMGEIAMRMLMALVSGFEVDVVAEALKIMVPSRFALDKMVEHLKQIVVFLEE